MFFERYKKLIFIFGFIAVVIALGYLIFFLFFKPSLDNEEAPSDNISISTQGGLPASETGAGGSSKTGSTRLGEGGQTGQNGQTPSDTSQSSSVSPADSPIELTKSASVNAALSPNGSDLQYYDKSDGKFYRVDKNGTIAPLTDKIFHSVEKITWSPDKNKAILEYPDGANIVYNFITDKQVSLPGHWKDFDFSPDGKQLVMKSMGLDPGNRWLAITNEDGSMARKIEALGDKDETVYPSWSPNKQIIAMYTEGIDFDRQDVYFVGLNNENFKSLTIEGRGFQPKWAPEGDKLLYSTYSSKNNLKPSLWIDNASGDAIGSGRKSLDVETWADKCAFKDSSTIYCAVPEKLDEGAGLFPELAKNTKDRLYEIDTNTGMKKIISSPEGSFTMSDIIISENGYNLYFTDEQTGKIYTVKIK